MNPCDHHGQYTWMLKDARGIPVCTVCSECEQAVMSGSTGFRSDIFTDSDYWTDEPIEEAPC